MHHNYLTLSKTGKSLYKVKGSKHFGYAIHVKTAEDIQERLNEIKEEHHSARHVCYAWRLGADKEQYRANDDGEPSNSAGKPILGQIEKYDLTNVLIAVVRYFGGTKLGVGGLIDAYRTAADMAIEDATILERQLMAHFTIHFGYDRMSDVMRIIRTNGWESMNQDFRDTCTVDVVVLPENQDQVPGSFEAFSDVDAKLVGIF